MTHHGLRASIVTLVGVIVASLSTLLWMWMTGRGDLVPLPPWISLITFVALGIFVLAFAWPVRRFVQGKATTSLDQIRAARTLVLAQAAALTGAAGAGWHVGQLVVLLRDLDLVTNQHRTWRVLIALACAVFLAGAGLLAQQWCRLPPRDEDPAGSIDEGA